MALWRIHPVADPQDARWQGRRIWAEVLVRAGTAAMARVVASRLDEPPVPNRIGNESLCFRSGLSDEKLYWVQRASREEAASRADRGTEAEVIAATLLHGEGADVASPASARPAKIVADHDLG